MSEDVRAESELAHVGYRGRVITELLQNAADASAADGTALVSLVETEATGVMLEVANTGTPLDCEGLSALTALRQSSKAFPEQSLGHFGVGFASVLSVTDEPEIATQRAVFRFSAQRTRAAVGVDGQVPVLRVPFAEKGSGRDGYATTVRLPLRDQEAVEAVRAEWATLGDWLLVAMPSLSKVVLDDKTQPSPERRVIENLHERWHVVRRNGELPLEIRSSMPQHRQHRASWTVSWAFPLNDSVVGDEKPVDALEQALAQLALGSVSASSGRAGSICPSDGFDYVCAPTPTAEQFTWPTGLVASFPVSEDRRRILAGENTSYIVDIASGLFADQLVEMASEGQSWWHCIPAKSGSSRIESALMDAVEKKLLGRKVICPLADVNGSDASTCDVEPDYYDEFNFQTDPGSKVGRRAALSPDNCTFLSSATLSEESGLLSALAAVGIPLAPVPSTHHEFAMRIGMRSTTLVGALRSIELSPLDPIDSPGVCPLDDSEVLSSTSGKSIALWCSLFRMLRHFSSDADVREAIAEMPIPLSDGRIVHGGQGCYLISSTTDSVLASALHAASKFLGLRVVHPTVVQDEEIVDFLLHSRVVKLTASEFLAMPELRSWVASLREHPADRDTFYCAQTDESDAVEPWQVCYETICVALESHLGSPEIFSPSGDFASTLSLYYDNAAGDRDSLDDSAAAIVADLRGQILLPDDTGEPTPASELTLATKFVDYCFDSQLCSPIDPDLGGQFPAEVWEALGVHSGFQIYPHGLIDLIDLPPYLADCDGAREWAEQLPPGVVQSMNVIHGLDLVEPSALLHVLHRLWMNKDFYQALASPVWINGHDGQRYEVTGYSCWWLKRELELEGRTTHQGLTAWLRLAPQIVSELPSEFAQMLGVVTSYSDLDAEGWQQLMDDIHATSEPPPAHALADFWYHLGLWAREHEEHEMLELPEYIWTVAMGGIDRVAVADIVASPLRKWHFHPDSGPLLPAQGKSAVALAAVCDVPLWDELSDEERPAGIVTSEGVVQQPPTEFVRLALRAWLPLHTFELHTELTVDGHRVPFWVDSSTVYVESVDYLPCATALAEATPMNVGRWKAAAADDPAVHLWTVLSEEKW